VTGTVSARPGGPDPARARADEAAPPEQWPRNWDAVVAAVGGEYGEDEVAWGPDEVELTGIRRFVEPFELDCPLHYDRAAALAMGYSGVVAPAASIRMFAAPALWEPGREAVFTDPGRDALPAQSSPGRHLPSFAPATTALVMTEVAWDFLRPVIVGDRLGTHKRKRIAACTPKALRIGRGAFITIEHRICNQNRELVARIRLTYFAYNPGGS
jgi:MaoC dehydratase-like protein